MDNWIAVEKELPPRPRRKKDGTTLISNWVKVLVDHNEPAYEEKRFYYHIWHGWMEKGGPEGDLRIRATKRHS